MQFDRLIFCNDLRPRPGPVNMAMDEVLLSLAARTEIPVLRVYRWSASWISFGYFQRWAAVSPQVPENTGAVRRWTGGGTVDHRNDQTYSLMVPRDYGFARCPAAESYARVHEWLALALAGEGVRTALAPDPSSRAPSDWCFADPPVAGDLISGDRKLAGAAQRRTLTGLLHQGSLSVRPPEGAWPWEKFAALLAAEVIPFQPGSKEEDESAKLARDQYGSEAWLERR